MNPIFEKVTGMNAITDQVIAMDLLNAAKSGVRNYAFAVTESGTPEIKETLIRHLEEALDQHEQISNYLVENGWYHSWNPNEQI
jgi:similar to spore coat protein